MYRLFFLTALTFFPGQVWAQGEPPKVERSWTMSSGAHSFVFVVGKKCLTDPDATITTDGRDITVYDTPSCTLELEQLAEAWLDSYKAQDESLVTIHGKPHSLKELRLMILNKNATDSNVSMRFLADTQYCHCLVIASKNREDLADIGALETEEDTVAEDDRDDSTTTLRDPAFDKDLQETHKKGLILDFQTEPMNSNSGSGGDLTN